MSESFECVVEFGGSLNTSDFKVVELNSDLFQAINQKDTPVVFKGDTGDNVVMCDADKTFQLRSLETSNTLLLSVQPPQETDARVIQGSITQHYESKRQPPDVHKLKRLLSECYYQSHEDYCHLLNPMGLQVSSSLWDATQAEDSQSSASLSHSRSWDASHSGPRQAKRQKPNLYTKADLRQRVLCSDAELDAALDALNCIVTSHGHVMLPAPDAVTACLDSLLTIAAGGWDLERIAEPQCLAEMQDFHDPALISHVLRSYCRPGAPPAPDGTPVWALDIPKVCRFRARQLFEAAASWREADFMAQWSAIVPDGVAPALDMLRGDVVLEAQGALRRVCWFPREALPQGPRQRFAALFERRAKWAKEDIVPFLADLTGPGLTPENLLAKNAREHQEDGVTMYCRAS